MGGSYEPVPTTDDRSYPPHPPVPVTTRHIARSWITRCARAGHSTLLVRWVRWMIALVMGGIILLSVAFSSGWPFSSSVDVSIEQTGQAGLFLRDSRPMRTAMAFWKIAQQEVRDRGLDTCNDRLGRSLIDAYARSKLDYCTPNSGRFPHIDEINRTHQHWTPASPEGDDVGDAAILCTPVHRDDFSKWWPYPASPCLSVHLRPEGKQDYFAPRCKKTVQGEKLDEEMGKEDFLGKHLKDGNGPKCKRKIEHTVLFIGRQDQWNPFHVAEDLITTFVTLFIAATVAPSLINDRIQLVFRDDYTMDANHFTALWSRMGAWSPKRLSLDPWQEGDCLTNAIHSVGAGASLLSAMGVGRSYQCASTITWASSLYYRHLFGLTRPDNKLPSEESRSLPLNILWLSRGKFDRNAQANNEMSPWRLSRVLQNEPEFLANLRQSLAGLCAEGGAGDRIFGSRGCVYEDAQDVPETWSNLEPVGADDPVPVRFAAMDPSVHDLESQIHYVGHTTILVSQHGGSLGLSLFLQPGEAAVLELQVSEVRNNFHFEHMAFQSGNEYKMTTIQRTVDSEVVWASLQQLIQTMVRKRAGLPASKEDSHSP